MMSSLARAVVATLLLPACSWESNAVDLPAVDGVPVAIDSVHMRRVFATKNQLGGGEDPNTLQLNYEVRTAGDLPPHAAVGARMVCHVGGHAVVTRTAWTQADEGADGSWEQIATAIATPFQTKRPETCEAELAYRVRGSVSAGTDTDASDRSLGFVCFTDGKLHARACVDDELPRPPAEQPLQVDDIQAAIQPLSSGRFGLSLSLLLTAGQAPPDSLLVGAQASCNTRDGVQDLEVLMSPDITRLRPGETSASSGSTPNGRGLKAEPTACSLSLRYNNHGSSQPLQEFCVRGATISPGPCASASE